MKRQDIIQAAWAEAAHGVPFRVVVSPAHGAVVPEGLGDRVVLEIGPGLVHPCQITMNETGLLTTLTFGDGVTRGRPFDVELPWECICAVLTPDWGMQWLLGEPTVAPAPALRVVK